MATNRLSLCTLLVALSIIISTSAIRLADQAMDNDNNNVVEDRSADQAMDNDSINSFLYCFSVFERYQKLPFTGYDSWQDEMAYDICNAGGGVRLSLYQNTGRLPPGYKEALLIWHKNNQTMVDIEICKYDHRRCPEELQKIAFTE